MPILTLLASGSSGSLAVLVGMVLFHVLSCLRFKHLQLSLFRGTSPRLVSGHVVRGKRALPLAGVAIGWCSRAAIA